MLAGFDTAHARSLGACKGTFSVAENPIVVNAENLRHAVTLARSNGCTQVIRVLALVDNNLNVTALRAADWRIISRVGSVISLEGCTNTAPYLTAIPGILSIKMPSLIYPCLDSARKRSFVDEVHGTTRSTLPKSFTGKGVLVAIMDTEFDTRHPALLDSAGKTRFVAIWDQADSSGKKLNRYGYGAIKNSTQLQADSLFASTPTSAFHGTPMTCMAAGSERSRPYYGVAPDAALIGLKYDQASDNDLVDGLRWIFSVADSLKKPCVVNMSIGSQQGPHDGTSLIDRCIDSLSGPGHIVVGATGNDGSSLTHVSFNLQKGDTGASWAAPAIDSGAAVQSTSVFDMWGEPGKVLNVALIIVDQTDFSFLKTTTPVSTSVTRQYSPAPIVAANTKRGINDTCIIRVYAEKASALNTKAHLLAVMYANNPALCMGFKVSVGGQTGGIVNVWNVMHHEFKSFNIAGFVGGDSVCTIDEIGATAKRNITVGGYVTKTAYIRWDGSKHEDTDLYMHRLGPFSGRGPTIDGRIKPDISAPATGVAGAISQYSIVKREDVVVWPDTLTTAGRYAMQAGTSVASPVVAGIVALMLQIDPLLTPEKARQVLMQTATTDSYTGPLATPNNDWGAGKANALGAVAALLGVVQNSVATGDNAAPLCRIVQASKHRFVLKSPGMQIAQPVTATIYSPLGRRLFSGTVGDDGSIEVPSLYSGVCIVRMYTGKTTLAELRYISFR
jgi:minor extracellular serine protease Vpr